MKIIPAIDILDGKCVRLSKGNYDISKIYYSVIGNYDLFNRRKFKLYVDNCNIEILMDNIYTKNIGDIFN